MRSWLISSRGSWPAFLPSRSTTTRSAHTVQFAKSMRNIDDADALFAEFADEIEQAIGLLRA